MRRGGTGDQRRTGRVRNHQRITGIHVGGINNIDRGGSILCPCDDSVASVQRNTGGGAREHVH